MQRIIKIMLLAEKWMKLEINMFKVSKIRNILCVFSHMQNLDIKAKKQKDMSVQGGLLGGKGEPMERGRRIRV
jgi:hypothetical protein